LTVFVAVIGVATLAQPPAQAAGESLTLDPASGQPGSSVSVEVAGFGSCTPVDDAAGVGGMVTVRWDGADNLGSFELKSGTGSLNFIVPESASLDTHSVTATCDTNGTITKSATFIVTRPEKPILVPNLIGLSQQAAIESLKEAGLVPGVISGLGDVVEGQDPRANSEAEPGFTVDMRMGDSAPDLVDVPDLTNLTLDEARQALSAVKLELGTSSGDGLRVEGQSPLPFSPAPVGSAVNVTMRTAARALVEVPDLSGRSVTEAPALLGDEGLKLGQVTGEGSKIIRTQRPRAGDLVPRGSSVSVSVEAGVRPQPLVAVPNLVGRSVAEAQDILEGLNLTLNVASDAGSIVDQSPEAGTLVPRKSIVSVRLEAKSTTSPWILVVAIVLLLGAGLAAGASYRTIRARRARAWLHEHISARPGVLKSEEPTVTSDTSEQPGHVVVGVQGEIDEGTHEIEDVRT
jgi:beta-lactam-binding protein with PASTA domain